MTWLKTKSCAPPVEKWTQLTAFGRCQKWGILFSKTVAGPKIDGVSQEEGKKYQRNHADAEKIYWVHVKYPLLNLRNYWKVFARAQVLHWQIQTTTMTTNSERNAMFLFTKIKEPSIQSNFMEGQWETLKRVFLQEALCKHLGGGRW